MNLHICIVTYNWPPRNAIGTHRPYAWAKNWSEAGAKVSVITSVKQSFDSPLDLHLPPLSGVDVYEIPYGHGNTFTRRLAAIPGVSTALRKIKSWLRRNANINIDPRLAWTRPAALATSGFANSLDIIVSTYGPESCHRIAAEIKASNPSLFWVADYRDLWSQNPVVDQSEQIRLTQRNDELETVGRLADMVSAVSKDMLVMLSKITSAPQFLLRNGFDISQEELVNNLRNRSKITSIPFRIVHTGTIYDGHRDPKPLLDVLCSMANKGTIRSGDVTVDFYGSRVEPIRKLAERSEYANFVRILGHVSREEALKAQKEADLLLLLEGTQIESRGVLTGKIFEYISSGRPIICLGSNSEYEIGQLLRETMTGEVLLPSEIENIETLLSECIAGRGLCANFNPNQQTILSFSRSAQSEEFLAEIIQMHCSRDDQRR